MLLREDLWIRESNLIEGVDDPKADERCLMAWIWFKEEDIGLSTILSLHARIYSMFDPALAGRFRPYDVWIGSYKPPPFAEVPALMAQWIWDRNNSGNWLEIKRAHIKFERIHPFADGNGRVGRMVMNRQRVEIGMEPLLIRASGRRKYYKWFEERRD